MIHLFLDDSGKESQPQNPWVCMAGYLADYEPLIGLHGTWRQLMLRHGIQEIHMKQLIPMAGMYQNLGWDHDKRDAVVQDFVRAINETRMSGVGVAVETAAWAKCKKEHPSPAWGTIQQFCLERLLSRVIEQMHDAGIDDTLALVFDTDPDFGPNRFNLFCALMGHDPRATRRLSSITFGHPVYYPGLQAADLLVWETRKELMQKREGYRSTRRWEAMFTKMPNYHLEYTVGERWDDAQFAAKMPEITENLRRFSAASAGASE
jgi:hypothetical protein